MMDDINAPPFSGLGGSVLFGQNYFSRAQIVVNQGGTSSGKTYAIEQVLFCLACQTAKLVITVVAQDVPNLKAGALRDALNIYQQSEALQNAMKNFNKTDRVFEFTNGSIIEFKSYDNAQDAKSGKRDYLFVNEANGISWDIYHELALRTRQRTIAKLLRAFYHRLCYLCKLDGKKPIIVALEPTNMAD